MRHQWKIIQGIACFNGFLQNWLSQVGNGFFQGQCKSVVVLSEAGSSIVQLDHGHKSLLVSTKQRTIIYRTDESTVQVGQKERKMWDFSKLQT